MVLLKNKTFRIALCLAALSMSHNNIFAMKASRLQGMINSLFKQYKDTWNITEKKQWSTKVSNIIKQLSDKKLAKTFTERLNKQMEIKPPTPADVPKKIAQKIHGVTLVIEDVINQLQIINKNTINLQPHEILRQTVKSLEPIDTIYTKQELKSPDLHLQKYKEFPTFKQFINTLKDAQEQLKNNKRMLIGYEKEDYQVVAGSYDALIIFFETVFHDFLT